MRKKRFIEEPFYFIMNVLIKESIPHNIKANSQETYLSLTNPKNSKTFNIFLRFPDENSTSLITSKKHMVLQEVIDETRANNFAFNDYGQLFKKIGIPHENLIEHQRAYLQNKEVHKVAKEIEESKMVLKL